MMHIILKHVKEYTNLACSEKVATSFKTPDILSLRNLRNKITEDTIPTVTIDHGQTAMLALLNGIRSRPTMAKPMPAGFLNNPEGGSYGNDNQWDARLWGHDDANAALSPEDFNQKSSLNVRRMITSLAYEGKTYDIVKQGFHPTRIEKIYDKIRKDCDGRNAHELKCGIEGRPIEVCMCGDPCAKDSALCKPCFDTVIVSKLVRPTQI